MNVARSAPGKPTAKCAIATERVFTTGPEVLTAGSIAGVVLFRPAGGDYPHHIKFNSQNDKDWGIDVYDGAIPSSFVTEGETAHSFLKDASALKDDARPICSFTILSCHIGVEGGETSSAANSRFIRLLGNITHKISVVAGSIPITYNALTVPGPGITAFVSIPEMVSINGFILVIARTQSGKPLSDNCHYAYYVVELWH